MKIKIFSLLLIVLVVAIVITSIVSKEEEYDIIVGRVCSEAHILEESKSESLNKLGEDFSADIKYIESSDIKTSLEELSNNIHVDMIWLEGKEQVELAEELAQKNKSMDYILVGKALGADTPSNAVGVMFKMEQVAFLAGALASDVSSEEAVGFIGCKEYSDSEILEYGYRAGVSFLNSENDKETEVELEYVGLGEDNQVEAIEKMADSGVDIVFMAVDKLSKETLDFAESRGIGLIVKDGSLEDVESSSIVAKLKKKSDIAIYEVIRDFHQGQFGGGSTNLYGLEEDAVDIVYGENSKLRAVDMEKVDILKNLIRSEKMDIPIDEETFTRYVESMVY